MRKSIVVAALLTVGLAGAVFWKSGSFSSDIDRSKAVRQDGLVSEELFLAMAFSNDRDFSTAITLANENWHVSYVPMLLEVAHFVPFDRTGQILELIRSQTGQNFGIKFDGWFQWIWSQEFEQHPGYANFKSKLYEKKDARFPEYFVKTDNATIRMDEIRWGGVQRDGIPPLKDPEMLAAKDAIYLADSDVVFGIELNGDARAYPKRILAWHEMFKDRLGGESICGVY